MVQTPPEVAKLRVLYVNHVGQLAGAEQSLLELLRKLDRDKIEPLAALPSDGPLAPAVARAGATVLPVPMRRLRRTNNPLQLAQQSWSLWRCGCRLGRIIDDEAIDLVHANSLTALLYLSRHVPAECPVIWHARDLRQPRWLTRRLAGRATRIIAVSQAVADAVADCLPAATEITTVIHNGLDLQRLSGQKERTRVRSELGLASNARLVGTVGQLVPWKNQELFLRACAQVALHQAEAEFLVIGADLFGEHEGYCQWLRDLTEDLGLARRTHFLGWRNDVPRLLGALDVFVLPSREEPFGRALLEAMAAGLPVIAVAAGGPKELIDPSHDGILIPPPGHPSILAAMINQVLDDRALARRLGERARQRATRFTSERTARLVENVYDEVLWEATEELT